MFYSPDNFEHCFWFWNWANSEPSSKSVRSLTHTTVYQENSIVEFLFADPLLLKLQLSHKGSETNYGGRPISPTFAFGYAPLGFMNPSITGWTNAHYLRPKLETRNAMSPRDLHRKIFADGEVWIMAYEEKWERWLTLNIYNTDYKDAMTWPTAEVVSSTGKRTTTVKP
jgi:hypothetical protein